MQLERSLKLQKPLANPENGESLMERTLVSLAILYAGIAWGGWPVLSRSAGETGVAGAAIISLSAAVTVVVGGLILGFDNPNAEGLWKLLFCGVMMGTGLYAFNYVAGSSVIPGSQGIPTIYALMIAVTAVGMAYFFSEHFPWQRMVGVGLLMAGVYFIFVKT